MTDGLTGRTWKAVAEAREQLIAARDAQLADKDRELTALRQRLAEAESAIAAGANFAPDEWAAIEQVARDYSFGNQSQYNANMDHARQLRRQGHSASEIVGMIERGGSPRPGPLSPRQRGLA